MAVTNDQLAEALADLLEAIVALSYGDNRHRLVKICQDRQRLLDQALERPSRSDRYQAKKNLPHATPDEAERMLRETKERQRKQREQRVQHQRSNGQPDF